jgi:hypothetical protein
MLLAAMLAMVLAAAAPAFAQAVGGKVQYVDCDQIQAAATGQYNFGNQGVAAALSQQLGVSQNQVLACLGSTAAGGNIGVGTASAAAGGGGGGGGATATAGGGGGGGAASAAPAAAGGGGGGGAAAAAGGALPPTGGASLLALGAGALLVGGGLLARRILR